MTLSNLDFKIYATLYYCMRYVVELHKIPIVDVSVSVTLEL